MWPFQLPSAQPEEARLVRQACLLERPTHAQISDQVADLPDASFEKYAEPVLAKFRDMAPMDLLDGPTAKTLGEFAARYAKVLSRTDAGKKLLSDPAGPFALLTPLPANPELFYPTELAKLSLVNGELLAIQKTAPVPVMVLVSAGSSATPKWAWP